MQLCENISGLKSRFRLCVKLTKCCGSSALLLFIFLLLTVLQQTGLQSQPLRHGRYHGSALPAAVLRDQEGDVTVGSEEAHRGLELLTETTEVEPENIYFRTQCGHRSLKITLLSGL